MREIGGFIEFESFRGKDYHEKAIALNCGRNCLAYILQARKISKIALPYFLCDSVSAICRKYNVEIRYYHIDNNFMPQDVHLSSDEWIYIVNYYGQLNQKVIYDLYNIYERRIILDQAQAFFEKHIKGIDTLYTCRKFFGVADGAYLYTDAEVLDIKIQEKSYDRMHFLLGRYEETASKFYKEYVNNNAYFDNENIKMMSKLTSNILKGLDYTHIKKKRNKNFTFLYNAFKNINKLELTIPDGPFMYPLYVDNGYMLRKKLQDLNIYIPILWPDVFNLCEENELEYDMAKNILPIPIDQRYDDNDMEYIVNRVRNLEGSKTE